MQDSTFFNGRTINFYARLSSSGLHIEVKKELFDTPDESDQFKKHIRSERDVVQLRFI
jgi:hypothetical protein